MFFFVSVLQSQKLTDLSKSKLPEDLLESLDSEIPKKKKKQSANKLKKKEKKREEEDEGLHRETKFEP